MQDTTRYHCPMKRRFFLLLLALFASTAGAAFLDKEVSFSEAEVQAALDKSSVTEFRYGGLLALSLLQPPRVTLGVPAERIGIAAQMNISMAGAAPVPLEMSGTAGIRYDDQEKAFYLENPVAESVRSPALSRDGAHLARSAVTQLMAGYFRKRPVYVLREDGNAQEKAARWLLRSVRVEPGRVVAILSPF